MVAELDEREFLFLGGKDAGPEGVLRAIRLVPLLYGDGDDEIVPVGAEDRLCKEV